MNAPTQNAFSASSRTASTATDSSGIGIANQPANDIPAPSPKPRELKPEKQLPTYVYQDFANAEPSMLGSTTVHERVPPHSLQSQKLPCKLAAMLSDAELSSIITWMPHGRSWKILNRELFSNFALPRYFGHSNHASFVRIVNAWGFRRITRGVDRDTYYHELFLRGKPRLHERMKRLPSCHRKTPVDKEDRCPDFYELAKTSPLPEVSGSASSLMNPINSISAGYLGNMAASFPLSGLGNSNAMLGNLHGSAGSLPQGNDMSALLQLLRHQPMQQQQAPNANQNLMQQFARLQGMSPNAFGQFGNQPSAASMNQAVNASAPPQNHLSIDKISPSDVIQLRSIERTNELLAQKLASMQQDTMMMKQNAGGADQASVTKSPMPIKSNTVSTTSSNPSKEEMLLQMLLESQANGAGKPNGAQFGN